MSTDEIRSLVAATRAAAKAERERDEARAEAARLQAEAEAMRAGVERVIDRWRATISWSLADELRIAVRDES